MRLSLLLAVLCIAASLTTSSAAQDTERTPPLTSEEIRALFSKVAEKDRENDKRSRDYTYIQRQEEHKLNGKGETQSVESKTYEVMILYEDPVLRQIAKDDKPLSAKDAEKEDEKIQKIIDKRKNESDDDRRKRLEKVEKEREESRKFVSEIAEAYDFRHVDTEDFEGRETYVIDAEPRPGYEPHSKDAKFLTKFRFRVWIDKTESQWVKVDALSLDTVSFGLFLVRLHKGARVQVEQTRVNDEVWLPQHINLKVDAKVALLKGFNMDIDITYRDYKKFHTDTKIVPGGEVTEK